MQLVAVVPHAALAVQFAVELSLPAEPSVGTELSVPGFWPSTVWPSVVAPPSGVAPLEPDSNESKS
jgi:hypothetical protein